MSSPRHSLHTLRQALADLRSHALTDRAFVQTAREQTQLFSALPPKYETVWLNLVDRLESSDHAKPLQALLDHRHRAAVDRGTADEFIAGAQETKQRRTDRRHAGRQANGGWNPGDRRLGLVVDDSVVIRGMISRWIDAEPDMKVAASLRTAAVATLISCVVGLLGALAIGAARRRVASTLDVGLNSAPSERFEPQQAMAPAASSAQPWYRPVVSDAKGVYAFPRTHVAPGKYTLKIRAAGYDLTSANTAEVASGKTAKLDLTLDAAKDPSTQLTSADWLNLIGGTEQQKFSAQKPDERRRTPDLERTL